MGIEIHCLVPYEYWLEARGWEGKREREEGGYVEGMCVDYEVAFCLSYSSETFRRHMTVPTPTNTTRTYTLEWSKG